MDLTLYRVIQRGGMNRVALGDLADGVEFYSAEKNDQGVITLTPVQIQDGSRRTTIANLPGEEPIPGTLPASGDLDDTDPPFEPDNA